MATKHKKTTNPKSPTAKTTPKRSNKATSSNINRSKGSKDASEWLPPNEEYHCRYVIQQINIKKTYELSITEPERDAMKGILDKSCQSSQ